MVHPRNLDLDAPNGSRLLDHDVAGLGEGRGGAAVTDAEIAAIEARCRAATPGPWTLVPGAGHADTIIECQDSFHACGHRTVMPDRSVISSVVYTKTVASFPVHDLATPEARAVIDFILHSRTDVEALCAEVRRLRDAWESERRVYRADAEANATRAEKAEAEVRRLREEGLRAVQHGTEMESRYFKADAEVARLTTENARLSFALDAAARIVKRHADRAAGREET